MYGQAVKRDYQELGRQLYEILDCGTPGDVSESDVEWLQVTVHNLLNCATDEFAKKHSEVVCVCVCVPRCLFMCLC